MDSTPRAKSSMPAATRSPPGNGSRRGSIPASIAPDDAAASVAAWRSLAGVGGPWLALAGVGGLDALQQARRVRRAVAKGSGGDQAANGWIGGAGGGSVTWMVPWMV